MTKVALNGMRFYAFHGFYDFERRVGTNFVLDVELEIDLSTDPDDKIENTVNYENVYAISNKYMQLKYKLLESLVFDIATEIKSEHDKIQKITVRLSKLNPPLAGKVDRATVEISLD